jgi:hypothetical protein
VGLGTGVAKIVGAGAVPFMISGFASAGMVGPASVKTATGIGIGLTLAFATFTMPIVIAGPPSIAPSAGVGVGKIV